MSRRKASSPSAALPPIPEPAPTAETLAQRAEISRKLDDLIKIVTERNLLRAQRLVEMALRGQAPVELVEHFSMIGRNYYELADNGPPKPKLRTIEGGKA